MGILENRPLARLCLFFLGGLLTASLTDSMAGLLPGLLAVLFLSGIGFARLFRRCRRPSGAFFTTRSSPSMNTRNSRTIVLTALALLAGQLFGAFQAAYFHSMEDFAGQEVTVVAEVREIRYESDYGAGLRAELLSLNGIPCSGLVEWDANARAQVGDCLTLRATILPIRSTRSLSEAIWFQADGVCAELVDASDFTLLSHREHWSDRVRAFLSGLRGNLSARLRSSVTGEAGSLMSAMLLGERDLLSPETRRDFRRVGLSHILALSGLHLSILIGALHALLCRTRLRRRSVLLSEIALLLFYMALTGFPLSVVRAGIMTILALSSFFFAREADGITSLLFAAVLICMVSPFAVYDCGLWLSVTATFGILLAAELFPAASSAAENPGIVSRIFRYLRLASRTTLSALCATLPLMALLFGELSLLSLPANLLLGPLLSLYLLLALPMLLLASVPFLGWPVTMFGNFLLSAVHYAASFPHVLLPIGRPGVALILSLTALLLLFLLCTRMSRNKILRIGVAGLTAAALCLSVSAVLERASDLVFFRSDGKNDALLFLSDGQSLLCDLSNASYAGASLSFSLSEEAGLTEVDSYMITHYHTAHISTTRKMLARYTVRALWLPTPESEAEEQIYRSLCALAEENGISCHRYDPYATVAVGRLTLTVHGKGHLSSSTHPTVALTADGPQGRLTYLGAASHESDTKETAASAVATSDFLILGTHGPSEHTPIAYPRYSKNLCLAVVPDAAGRLDPTLYRFLSDAVPIYEETTEVLRITLRQTGFRLPVHALSCTVPRIPA